MSTRLGSPRTSILPQNPRLFKLFAGRENGIRLKEGMDFIAAQMVAPRKRDALDRERLAAVSLAKKQAKHKGRNHWRNWERRQMALAKKRAAAITIATRKAAFERYCDATRAFWAGERADHPVHP